MGKKNPPLSFDNGGEKSLGEVLASSAEEAEESNATEEGSGGFGYCNSGVGANGHRVRRGGIAGFSVKDIGA